MKFRHINQLQNLPRSVWSRSVVPLAFIKLKRRHPFADNSWWACWHQKMIITFFEWSPTVKHYPDIVLTYHLEVYMAYWFWHSIWYFFLADTLTFYLTFYLASIDVLSGISSDILSGILSGISSEILRGWGPAGNILIRSSQLRSGGKRSDPELAVRARRGTLRSSACSWGPAGNTLILSLLFGFGGEHSDLALAVEVWRRRGRSRRREAAGQLT